MLTNWFLLAGGTLQTSTHIQTIILACTHDSLCASVGSVASFLCFDLRSINPDMRDTSEVQVVLHDIQHTCPLGDNNAVKMDTKM